MDKVVAQRILAEVQNVYEKIAADYSAKRWFIIQYLRKLAQKYVCDEMKVLDVGCGNARLFFLLLKDWQIEYTGIDNCEEFLKKAKQKYQTEAEKIKIKPPVFMRADILNLPISDEQFDLVFCCGALHHVPSLELRLQAVKEIYRVLRKGGRVIFTNWDIWNLGHIWHYGLWRLLFGLRYRNLDRGDTFAPWGAERRYFHAFTVPEMSNLLQMVGFKILENYYADKEGGSVSRWRGENLISVGEK